MIGFQDPKESAKTRQCLVEIYEASKEKPIYNESENLCLIRYSQLKRCFTVYEANNIWLIHARIPVKSKAKDDPKPWMEKGIKSKRSFYDVNK